MPAARLKQIVEAQVMEADGMDLMDSENVKGSTRRLLLEYCIGEKLLLSRPTVLKCVLIQFYIIILTCKCITHKLP